MKTYNNFPSVGFLKLNPHSISNLESDKKISEQLNLKSLDFALWFDESLLEIKDLDLNKKPFDFILYLLDNNYINSRRFFNNSSKSNFRIACLLFSKFVKCDVSKIKSIREEYIKDNSEKIQKEKEEEIDFNSYISYNRLKSNKKIFLYLLNHGCSRSVISELISRRFICFDDKYNNIIYINSDLLDMKSIEKHGIGEKHFMRLEGTPFPFCYWKDTENIDNKRFTKVEVFKNTLELIQYISENEAKENILYISTHSDNFNIKMIDNLKEIFGDIELHYNFESEKIDMMENSKKEIEDNDIEKDIIENHFKYSNEILIQKLIKYYDTQNVTFLKIDEENGLRMFRIINPSGDFNIYENLEDFLPF